MSLVKKCGQEVLGVQGDQEVSPAVFLVLRRINGNFAMYSSEERREINDQKKL